MKNFIKKIRAYIFKKPTSLEIILLVSVVAMFAVKCTAINNHPGNYFIDYRNIPADNLPPSHTSKHTESLEQIKETMGK
jgi:hypothetical protein